MRTVVIQLALFLRSCSAGWTFEIQGQVILRHSSADDFQILVGQLLDLSRRIRSNKIIATGH
jgi:hypothetical protein